MKDTTNRAIAGVLIVGLLASVVLAGVVSFYASANPDGLEYVAEQQGFAETAEDSPTSDSALADYGVAGVDDERWSVGLAGVVGVGVTALVGFGLFLFLASGSDTRANERRG
jgi:hypothetical protein